MNIPDEHDAAIKDALKLAMSTTLNKAGWSDSRGKDIKRFKAALVAIEEAQARERAEREGMVTA